MRETYMGVQRFVQRAYTDVPHIVQFHGMHRSHTSCKRGRD